MRVSQRPFVDFYLVLGIDPSATPKEISAAYLSLARRHHPDSSESEDDSAAEFKAVAEAYETLSNPQSRREYDRRRKRKTFPSQTQPKSPLQPKQASGGSATFWRDFRSTVEQPTFSGLGRDAGNVGVSDTISDLPISPEEARVGGRVVFTLAVTRPCGDCEGKGCTFCGGQGNAKQRRRLYVDLPPRVVDGSVLRLLGENVCVCIRIRPYW